MINIKKSKDSDFYTHRIWAFGSSMDGNYFTTDFRLIKFIRYQENKPFSLSDLQELFKNNPEITIEGKLISIPFKIIENEIIKGLSHQGNSYEESGEVSTKSRFLIFFDIINDALEGLPPDQCFEQKNSSGGCLFGENWVIWGSCFILIKKKIGIILTCGAWG